jgi:membrane protease YdiL (CAAX protease family)
MVQVLVTGVMGTVLYSLRRASGRLWPCVVLHAAYDWVVVQGAVI